MKFPYELCVNATKSESVS